MNKFIKISSLGLVALLASCGNKVAPFKRISPSDALRVTRALEAQRTINRNRLLVTDHDADTGNPLFTKNRPLFPFLSKKMSADITIKHNEKLSLSNAPNFNEEESIVIKKHIFFDLEHLYYHCRLTMERETNDGIDYKYPEVNHYDFFIEDKEQSEEITSDYNKTGGFFSLNNIGGTLKFSHVNGVKDSEGTKKDFISRFLLDFFVDESPIVSVENSFDLYAATSFSLSSVVMNWEIMNAYFNTPLPTVGGDTTLVMSGWLDSISTFPNFIDACRNAKDQLETLEKENTYFNYGFKSADAMSLLIETDFSYKDDEPTLHGVTTQTSSIAFRNTSLSDSHFVFTSETEQSTGGLLSYSYTNTSFDQNINYNPVDKVEIPSDYLDYTQAV